MKRLTKLFAVGFMAGALLGLACSKKSDTAATTTTSSDLTISGKLGTSSSVASFEDRSGIKPFNARMAVTLTDLEFYAIAFSTPPAIAKGDVGSDGSFTVNLTGAKGSSVTAIFRDKNDQSQVGVVVFEDTSTKDMNGNAKTSSSVVLNDTVALGNITLGTDGKVKIPVSQISTVSGSSGSVASGTAFDPTGQWKLSAYDGTLPTGYKTIAAGQEGPQDGEPVTLVRFAGKAFTKGAGCTSGSACTESSGTVGTSDKYALSIWGGTYANGIAKCGGVSGFTQDEARYYGEINLSTAPTFAGNAMTFGPYVYTSTGFGGDPSPYNKAWMKTGATASHSMQDCQPKAIGSSGQYRGWACKAKVKSGNWPGTPISPTTYAWQVGVEGGGCQNSATGKPVNVTNWSNIGNGTCTEADASATYGTGFKTWTCTYSNVSPDGTSAAINLSCTHTGGHFTDSSGPTSTPYSPASGQYLGESETLVTSGQACKNVSSSTTAGLMAGYRCYAEAYWSGNGSRGDCAREYRFDWAATDPTKFAMDSDRGKPKNAYITNIMSYSTDGQTATVEDEETEKITVQTGSNSSTFCSIGRRTIIQLKKLTASKILMDLKQSGQMNSTDAACQAAAKDALAGKQVSGGDIKYMLTAQNFIFYAVPNQ